MPKLGNMKSQFLLLGFLVLIPLDMSRPQSKELKKITFLPSWVPQQQFAGYYMAKEKGIYEKYGLDVTIMTGGYAHDVTTSLKSGETDFGIMFLYTGVMERAKGTKLVNIGQIFQRSGIMFIAKKKSGIKTLKDFNGKKIGIWRTSATELTTGFLRKHNINAEIVPFDKGINVFLKDAVDITVMMNYNEYKRLINSGINPDEIITFNFYDHEMNFPEDGIYCMENTYKSDPELCKNFVEASIEGWTYALTNTDETIEVINKYQKSAMIPYNRSHSLWMLNSMKDIISASDKNIKEGNLLKSDYDNLTNFLYENKYITKKPLYGDFYNGTR
jgi:NitT/TauT family transport system substrate-binding protein